jgi:DNA-directed RNA polymerase specialized sigma24 family protein
MTEEVYRLLSAPRVTRYRIKQIESQIRALEFSLLPSGIRYDQDKVQTSPGDQMSKTVTQISQLECQIEALKLQIPQQSDAIREACSQLDNEQERTVIVMYYIGGFHMDEIAEAMNYALSTVYKLRKQGQHNLDAIIRGK